MSVEIIAIAEEILQGNVINTNASYLSKALFQEGYKVVGHKTVSDDKKEIIQALKSSSERACFILVTGGLGATLDDITKEALCTYFETDLILDTPLYKRLVQKWGDFPFLEEQARVPKNAKILPNEIGCAPGFFFSKEKKGFFFLPGVPFEMQKMFHTSVLPLLQKQKPSPEKKQCFSYYLCLIKEQDIDPFLRKLKQEYPHLEIGIYPGLKKVCVSFVTSEKEIEKPLQAFEEKFSENIFSKESAFIEEALQKLFIQKKKTLALAESCTGGYMASSLTQFSGSSAYFLGSFVTYSNFLKREVLGVQEKTLQEEGAVSKKTAEEMLRGVFSICKADYAIAVTGIAGPLGGSAEKPVGTVFIALGTKEEIFSGKIYIQKERKEIIQAVKEWAFSLLWLYVEKGIQPRFL